MAKRKIEKIPRAGNKKEEMCTTTWENNWSASIKASYVHPWASQVVLIVKNLPANTGDIRDTGSILDWEELLEKSMATHSSILA